MKKLFLFITIFISFNLQGQIMPATVGANASIIFDEDAQNFIEVVGITDNLQRYALNWLTKPLKGYGFWAASVAIYPIIGGTVVTHKWNIKDPQDTDGAFRLVFGAAAWTHSSSGMDPDGTASTASTRVTPSTSLSLNSTHLAVYLNDSVLSASTADVMIGLITTDALRIGTTTATNNYVTETNNITTDNTVLQADGGFFATSRVASTGYSFFRNGATIATITRTSTALPTGQFITIGSQNNTSNVKSNWSARRVAYASIGTGIPFADMPIYYQIVHYYQTLLGRQL